MNYQESLDLLLSRGNEVKNIQLGLERIQAILKSLGDPHEKFAVLHIAGTNGKGSVAAMAESILRHANWKTGLFTSPHLERIEERIRVDGREVSGDCFADLVSRVHRKEASLLRSRLLMRSLTFFEMVTACAFLHFAEEQIDFGIIEVGLGGRLDATNVVHPQSCVITGIAYDHRDLLGDTLAQIAREKAGIIKPSIPVVSGCRAPEPRRVIQEEARRLGAPLLEIDRHCTIRVTGNKNGRYVIDLQTPHRVYRRVRLSLAGRFQVRNAALAIAGVEALPQVRAKSPTVRRALANTTWPGRMDEYRAERRTLLDGAHNPEGARCLRDHLCEQGWSIVHLVFGAMRDKDLPAIGKILFPLARTIHLARISNSRSAEPEHIAALVPRFHSRMRLHACAQAALRAAWQECPPDGTVVITGSLYLLGELLPMIKASEKSSARRQGQGES